VWGQYPISRTTAKGTFRCPAEDTEQKFALKKRTMYNHIMGIPVLPGDSSEYVLCKNCWARFGIQALYQKTLSENPMMVPTATWMSKIGTRDHLGGPTAIGREPATSRSGIAGARADMLVGITVAVLRVCNPTPQSFESALHFLASHISAYDLAALTADVAQVDLAPLDDLLTFVVPTLSRDERDAIFTNLSNIAMTQRLQLDETTIEVLRQIGVGLQVFSERLSGLTLSQAAMRT
jgi:hypothetical protein